MNLTFSSCLKDNAVFLFRLEYFLLEKHGIDVQGNAQFMTVQLKQRTDQFQLTFMAVKHTGMAVDFLFCFNVVQQFSAVKGQVIAGFLTEFGPEGDGIRCFEKRRGRRCCDA